MPIDWTEHHRFQEKDGYCGVAVIQMILANSGIEKTQEEIASDVYLKFWGVGRQIMLAYLSQYFKVTNYKDGSTITDVSCHLKKNHAVVLNWWNISDDGMEDGHYSIAADYSPSTKMLKLADPSNERCGLWEVKYSEFRHLWFDTLTLDNKIWSTGWMLWVDPKSKRRI